MLVFQEKFSKKSVEKIPLKQITEFLRNSWKDPPEIIAGIPPQISAVIPPVFSSKFPAVIPSGAFSRIPPEIILGISPVISAGNPLKLLLEILAGMTPWLLGFIHKFLDEPT